MSTSKKVTLFIVDDDPAYLKIVAWHLKAKNAFDIHTFESGEACLENLNLKPEVIVLDYYLGSKEQINGKEVFLTIQKISPKPKVIMMSGQTDGNLVLELINMGVRDYIIKEDKDALQELDEALEEFI
jgi:DNA-binding NtrC family response regulator